MIRSSRLTVLAAARHAEPGDVVAARDGSELVAVVRTEDGQLYVVPDRCPHDGGLLSDGYVEDGRLVCARHGWEFDPKTGQCPQREVCIESRRVVRRRRNPELPLELPFELPLERDESRSTSAKLQPAANTRE